MALFEPSLAMGAWNRASLQAERDRAFGSSPHLLARLFNDCSQVMSGPAVLLRGMPDWFSFGGNALPREKNSYDPLASLLKSQNGAPRFFFAKCR